jgi:hypothetical protein
LKLDIEIEKKQLVDNLQFMALFIAVYESFEDYIVGCPRSLFNTENRVNTKAIDKNDFIKEQEIKHAVKKRSAMESLEKFGCKCTQQQKEEWSIYANNDYIKVTEDDYIQWLSPEYNAKIEKRILTIKGKKQNKPNRFFNSVMFFVDRNSITLNEFDRILKIRNTRNDYVHEMADLIITDLIDDNSNSLFDDLINLYRKINNYWSVEFELSIGGDDIPQNVKIDTSNVISVRLYNLFKAVDAMQNRNIVINKKWCFFQGLYENLMLPIMEEKTNE